MRFCVLLCLLGLFSSLPCRAQDDVDAEPAGCEGHILNQDRSIVQDPNIDLSVVTVSLYTKGGLRKESQPLAPNGFFFVPIPDLKSLTNGRAYVMKIEGPEGWTFSPSERVITKDSCNQDINFVFSGFSITGKVLSHGGGPAPAGVTIKMVREGTAPKTTVTGEGGLFGFSNVFPGKVTVEASHETWKFASNSAEVEIGWANTEVPTDIVITHYDVTGKVVSGPSRSPVPSALVYLTPLGPASLPPSPACVEAVEAHADALAGLGDVYCAALTGEDGVYTIPEVGVGRYLVKLVPSLSGVPVVVQPAGGVELSVEAGTSQPSEPLEVTGVAVKGKVEFMDGSAVDGAKVTIKDASGKTYEALTDGQGVYRVDSVAVGGVSLTASKARVTIEAPRGPVSVGVSEPLGVLPPLRVTALDLCGSILLDQGATFSAAGRTVVLKSKHENAEQKAITDSQAHYCFRVSPGAYSLSPVITSDEAARGLALNPRQREAVVTKTAQMDHDFSQSRLALGGSVRCLETPCPKTVTVKVNRLGDRSGAPVTIKSDASGRFRMEESLPGDYRISVVEDAYCWKQSAIDTTVSADSSVGSPTFEQTGYKISLSSDFPSPAVLELTKPKRNGAAVSKAVNLPGGGKSVEVCLPEGGVYAITAPSALTFAKEYRFNTDKPANVDIKVTGVRISGKIVVHGDASSTILKPGEVKLQVAASSGQWSESFPCALEGPSPPSPYSFIYAYSFVAPPSSASPIQIKALASEDVKNLAYKPRTVSVPLSLEPLTSSSSGLSAPVIDAHVGSTVSGRVTPPVAGVLISVASPHVSDVFEGTTDAKGHFVIGPVYGGAKVLKTLQATATLDGYAFEKVHISGEGEADRFVFKATRQAALLVKLEGAKDAAVLISVSSATSPSFRAKAMTKPDGTAIIRNVAAGTYYVRAILKEFSFQSPSTGSSQATAVVKDGETSTVIFNAKRIAFSCKGTLRTLGGASAALQDAVVQAVGPKGELEESYVDPTEGKYSLHGLKPKISYTLSVVSKARPDAEGPILERASPATKTVVLGEEDLVGQDMTVFTTKASSKAWTTIMGTIDVSAVPSLLSSSRSSPTVRASLIDSNSNAEKAQAQDVSFLPYFEFSSLSKGDYDLVIEANKQVLYKRRVSVGDAPLARVSVHVSKRDLDDYMDLHGKGGPLSPPASSSPFLVVLVLAGLAFLLLKQLGVKDTDSYNKLTKRIGSALSLSGSDSAAPPPTSQERRASARPPAPSSNKSMKGSPMVNALPPPVDFNEEEVSLISQAISSPVVAGGPTRRARRFD